MTHTIVCEDRDHVEWHGGIPHAFVWGIAALMDLAAARKALQPYLLPRYQRQPHVTIAFGGLSQVEFDENQRSKDLEILTALCAGPFEIRPTSWGSLPLSPIVDLESDWLHMARHALCRDLPHRKLDSYRPHITVGFYKIRVPLQEPIRAVQHLELPEPWVAEELILWRYDTHDISGSFTKVGTLSLSSGNYHTS